MWLRVRGWWSLRKYEARDPESARELLVNTQHLHLISETEQGHAVLDWGNACDAVFFTEVPIDKMAFELGDDGLVADLRHYSQNQK